MHAPSVLTYVRSFSAPQRRPLAILAALFAFVLLVPAPPAQAQVVNGTLLGNVRDGSGAAIPGVTVTATEVNTNTVRTAVSNDTGYYILPNLRDGLYRVEAEIEGFKKFARESVKVDVNTTVRVDVALEVGDMRETVTVSAETPALQTDRTDTGRLIEAKQVQEMPLAFNRNFQGILVTVPGATRPFRPHSQFFNSQDSLATQVNGQSRLANNVLIEGVDNNQRSGLNTILIPSPDALETVSVSTSNYDAEFGRAGGALTNVTLRSGTNDVKGSAYFYGNTEGTNASDYFSHFTPETKFAQGGFTLGGPIMKNKLFFFGDYQRTIDNLGYVVRAVVPTAAMRNGDFSASSTNIYDPLTGNPDGTGRTAFANKTIPASRISPVAQNILKLMPMPNIDGAALGQVNFQQSQVREKTNDGFDVKLNYQLNPANQLSYRLSYQRPKVYDPSVYGTYGGPANDGFAGTGTNDTYSTAVNWTRVMSATFTMDVRGGLSYYHNIATAEGAGMNSSSDVGIPGANLDDFTSGLSRINIDGYTGPVIGFSPSMPWDRSEKNYNVAATFTKLLGNHTAKFGGEWRHNRDFLLQVQDAGGSRGQFTFRSAGTGSAAEAASTTAISNSFASFLLDWPNVVQRDLQVTLPGVQQWTTAAFFQDKWQVRSNVTLDLGLRWEYYQPFVGLEDQGGLSNYDPTTNALQVAGYGSVDGDLGVKGKKTNFVPRLGLSWRPDEKSVVRVGYGAGTIPFPDNRYAYNFPVKQNYSGATSNNLQRAGTMANGYPAPSLVNIPQDGIIPVSGTLLNSQYDVIPSGLHEGTLHSWNAAYQRQLPFSLTAEVAYIGNRGVDLVMDVDINASMVDGSGNAGRPQFVTFGRTGVTRVRTNDAKSKYHALQVKVDRRFKGGILITNSYTLGRGWDYVSENASIDTPNNYEKSWGRSDFDRLHNYVLSALYELPFGQGKTWLTDGIASKVIGGWQISNMLQIQSGRPLNIIGNGTTYNTPANRSYPNLNGDNTVLGGIGPGNLYFDPSVYSLAPAGTQGNMSRNGGPDGPGFWELDSSIFKRVAIGARRFAEFRVDIFNVTNSPRWDNPTEASRTYSTAAGNTFGQVTAIMSGSSSRTFRFGGRFVF
jgi:hypothetical protein